MRKFKLTALTVITGILPAFAACAQDTNTLPTDIQVFEAQTGTVIIKGFTAVGSVTASTGAISVRVKESDDLTTDSKLYGIAVVFESNQQREMAIVDYDELEPLLSGIDSLAKITSAASPMPAFEAGIATKSGLRVIAFSSQRKGTIQHFLQFNDGLRIALMPDQLSQFENLVSQAKASLDALRSGK